MNFEQEQVKLSQEARQPNDGINISSSPYQSKVGGGSMKEKKYDRQLEVNAGHPGNFGMRGLEQDHGQRYAPLGEEVAIARSNMGNQRGQPEEYNFGQERSRKPSYNDSQLQESERMEREHGSGKVPNNFSYEMGQTQHHSRSLEHQSRDVASIGASRGTSEGTSDGTSEYEELSHVLDPKLSQEIKHHEPLRHVPNSKVQNTSQAEIQSRTRTIFIPCDLSLNTMKAVEWVNLNLIRQNDRIVLINVRELTAPQFDQDLPKSFVNVAELHAEKEDEKRIAILKKFQDLLPGRNCKVKTIRGDPKTELVKFINQKKPTFVVAGVGLKGSFEGSLGEYLVDQIHVPVLLHLV